jgi:PAS domain S-box-containing protein
MGMSEEKLPKQPTPVAANALLAAIVQSSDDAIISKTLDGIILSWNEAAEDIFGYSASEAIGRPVSIIIPPDRGAEESDILQRISRGERIEHFETVRVRKDGHPVEVSISISPVVQDGRIIGASKIVRDITVRKQIERELAQHKTRLEVTLSSIGDAVIVTDLNGAVTFLNPVAEALTGFKAAEAVGQPIEAVFKIVNETTRRRVDNPVARALREGIVVGLANHTILVSRLGTEYAIDDSAAPIRDMTNELFGVVLVFRDVSGNRAAQDFRARLAAIVESSDDAIIGKDLSGRITSWNAGATRLFGYTVDEVIGRPISMLIPPDRLAEETNILERLRRGERVEHFETVRITKDRRKVTVSLTISPIRDGEGEIVGASKIARDITERKKIERELTEARAQLQKHSEVLEKVVAERTAELRDALGRLEAFSYSISHDLRAPLRAINGFVDIVMKDHAQELSPEAHELLERVAQSGARLATFIDEVLSSAQLKMTSANLVPIDLATLVPKIVEDYPNLREHRDAIIIRQPLHPVLASESLLTQCISNLLGNAVKFAPPSRPLKIEVWTESGGDGKVRLYVRDNGVGISAEERSRIFEIFSRGAATADVEGSGVGLAIVKRAAVRLGGDVGVTSTPGVGSEFWIELPMAPLPVAMAGERR